jgi:hypothetical protein
MIKNTFLKILFVFAILFVFFYFIKKESNISQQYLKEINNLLSKYDEQLKKEVTDDERVDIFDLYYKEIETFKNRIQNDSKIDKTDKDKLINYINKMYEYVNDSNIFNEEKAKKEKEDKKTER